LSENAGGIAANRATTRVLGLSEASARYWHATAAKIRIMGQEDTKNAALASRSRARSHRGATFFRHPPGKPVAEKSGLRDYDRQLKITTAN
jgi:hypothetical protein